jgi:putative DNA methylase
VRTRVAQFQQAGIGGVDLYLACFGPALEEFSRHWPLKRGTPRPKPEALKRRKQAEMFEDEWDPYGVTPEDALDAARREVKRWRLEQLTHTKASDELDPLTSFFVLAWDAFRAPVFPYDEALRLGRAVGVDLDKQVVGILVEKKGSNLVMWDSARRAAKGALGPADGSRGMIDAIHHAAHLGRTRTLQVAREMLAKVGVDKEQMFFAALEAVLEVLPVGKAFSGIDLDGDLGAAGSDFEALENLRKLALSEQVDSPKQLELWMEPLAV